MSALFHKLIRFNKISQNLEKYENEGEIYKTIFNELKIV